jgi:scyllo-inositol 2-dehydrogenase (NADP+)
MSNPIRVGVLGYGLAGRYFHLPFLQALDEFDVRAVATSRTEAQEQLPGVRIVAHADDIFEADDIDLVVIATPHRLHLPQTLTALKAGKHVVVEKPIAITTDEIKTVIETTESTGRLVIPFQNRRWDGDFQAIQKLVKSGILGTIHHFETHWIMFRPQPRGVWRDEPDQLGGILNDLGPHLIDQSLLLFGLPNTVSAQVMIHRANTTVDDAFRIQMHYDNGLYVLIETDALNGGAVPRFAIRGTGGTFEKFGVDPQEAALRAGMNPDATEWASWTEKGEIVCGGEDGLNITGEMDIPSGDYRDFYRGVASAITNGADSPVPLSDILNQIQTLEAVRESSQTGSPVKVAKI